MARFFLQHRYMWIALSALVAAASMAAAVALSHPYAGIIAVLIMACLLPVLPRLTGNRADTGQRHKTAPRSIPFSVPTEPLAQRIILTPGGETRAAQVVPLAQQDAYQFVLTVDGYMLLNENGQVVYTLRRDR